MSLESEVSYKEIAKVVGARVVTQCFNGDSLSFNSTLRGLELNAQELMVIVPYAQEVYRRARIEAKKENEYRKKAEPHLKTTARIIDAGTALAGIVVCSLTDSLFLGFAAYFVTNITIAGLERKYRYILSYLAGVKRRKFGDEVKANELTRKIVKELKELED